MKNHVGGQVSLLNTFAKPACFEDQNIEYKPKVHYIRNTDAYEIAADTPRVCCIVKQAVRLS